MSDPITLRERALWAEDVKYAEPLSWKAAERLLAALDAADALAEACTDVHGIIHNRESCDVCRTLRAYQSLVEPPK